MKLFILLSLFSINAIAGNWVPKSKIKSYSTVWAQKARCIAQESESCFEISGKDLRRWRMGLVDNLESIKYIPRDQAPCSDLASCQPLFEALDCSGYAKGSYPVMLMDYSEVYCAEPNGYNQKDGLVADAAGIVAADIADAAKATEKTNRKTKRDSRLVSLESCAKNSSMTPAQSRACVRSIAKELVRDRLPESDL